MTTCPSDLTTCQPRFVDYASVAGRLHNIARYGLGIHVIWALVQSVCDFGAVNDYTHTHTPLSGFVYQGMIDGDLCELYNSLDTSKKKTIVDDLDRTPNEVS